MHEYHPHTNTEWDRYRLIIMSKPLTAMDPQRVGGGLQINKIEEGGGGPCVTAEDPVWKWERDSWGSHLKYELD
jgi:hypothetical protein